LFDKSWKHLSDIPLADPTFGQPGKVDILLGVDIFTHVLLHDRWVGPPTTTIWRGIVPPFCKYTGQCTIGCCCKWLLGGPFERAFVDVMAFNLCARSNRQTSLQSTYRKHEQEKGRQNEQRVREVEHGTFTPLAMPTTGGMGRAASVFYK